MSKERLVGKLDSHPYGKLLKFAVTRTLDSSPFTKDETAAKGIKPEEFDQYATFLLDEKDGKYVAKFDFLQHYLGYVEMAATQRNAKTALVAAVLSILVSIIVAVPPAIKDDKPVELTSSQFQELIKATEQPVKLADSPLPVKVEDGQWNQIMPKNGRPNLFPAKKQ